MYINGNQQLSVYMYIPPPRVSFLHCPYALKNTLQYSLVLNAARARDMLVLGVCKDIMNTGSPVTGSSIGSWKKTATVPRVQSFKERRWLAHLNGVMFHSEIFQPKRRTCGNFEVFEATGYWGLSDYPVKGLQNEF